MRTVFAAMVVSLAMISWAKADPPAREKERKQPKGDSPATLFSRLDANQDGTLTSDEVEEEKKRLFDRMLRTGDANSDGKLSREEFLEATSSDRPERPLEKLAPERPGAQLLVMVRRLDTNQDGVIKEDEVPPQHQEMFRKLLAAADANDDGALDRRELVAAAPRIAAVMAKEGEKKAPDGRPDPRQLFSRLDANGDGKVEPEEVPEERRDRFTQLLEKADANRDGALDEKEFATALGAFARRAGVAMRPGGGPHGGPLMGALDANGDGELSGEEISAASSSLLKLDKNGDGTITPRELGPPPSMRPGPQMLLQRILRMDADGDGKISKDEAPEMLKARFDRVDSDGDGYLDKEELETLASMLRERLGRPRRDAGPPPKKAAAEKAAPKPAE